MSPGLLLCVMKASQFLNNKLTVKIFKYKWGEMTRSPSNDPITEARMGLTCNSGGGIRTYMYEVFPERK
jgi:hypothetical protein